MLYLDTSFLIPLFLPEATSDIIERFLKREHVVPLAISHWTRVEFSSALAREVRMGALSPKAAIKAENKFSQTTEESFILLLPTANDFDLATGFLQRYKTGLRAGDALHLAIASNSGAAAIYTLDQSLSAAGRRLGLNCRTGIRRGK